MKTFTIAGTSVDPDGIKRWRFANGDAAARAEVLRKHTITDIDLRTLPTPMCKEDAVVWLQSQGMTVDQSAAKPGPRRNVLRTDDEDLMPIHSGHSDDARAVTIVPRSKPKNRVEELARRLHRQEPYIRWLAWEHLRKPVRADLMRRAAVAMAA